MVFCRLFFLQAEGGIRDIGVTGVQTCALPISAEIVDSVAGAVLSAVAVLLVAWMVATPLANAPFPQVASQVKQSALVQAVDRRVPAGVRGVYDTLPEAIERHRLPEVLDPLTPTAGPGGLAPASAPLARPG